MLVIVLNCREVTDGFVKRLAKDALEAKKHSHFDQTTGDALILAVRGGMYQTPAHAWDCPKPGSSNLSHLRTHSLKIRNSVRLSPKSPQGKMDVGGYIYALHVGLWYLSMLGVLLSSEVLKGKKSAPCSAAIGYDNENTDHLLLSYVLPFKF